MSVINVMICSVKKLPLMKKMEKVINLWDDAAKNIPENLCGVKKRETVFIYDRWSYLGR